MLVPVYYNNGVPRREKHRRGVLPLSPFPQERQMKRHVLVGTLVGLLVTIGILHIRPRAAKAQAGLAHAESQFDITLNAPYDRVAPLFGANGERAWAGKEWDPQFVFPQPAADVPGAVFTVSHGPHTTLWLTPTFDLPNQHIQHVVLIPDYMITLL